MARLTHRLEPIALQPDACAANTAPPVACAARLRYFMLVFARFDGQANEQAGAELMQRTRQEASEGLLPDERERLIVEKLRAEGRVLAAELAAQLDTSEHTIRRHLRDLAEAGHCKRVYGGALLTSPANKPASVRMREQLPAKARLARAAAALVKPNQVILLDAGSTNVGIAAALPENAGLTVVTTSPQACVRLLERPGIEVILIGGRVSAQAAGTLGATALVQIQQIKADLCFLGACALDPAEGIAAFDAEDAEMKRAMVAASGQIAAAVTTEKLMTSAPFVIASCASLDYLVVDADVPKRHLKHLKAACDDVTVAR